MLESQIQSEMAHFRSKVYNCFCCFCCFPQVTTLHHGKYFAMKRVSKKHIVAKQQEEHVLFEKRILKAIQSDFIVR